MFAFLKQFGKHKNQGKNKQLDELAQRVRMNLSNNYKDAAQLNLKAFEEAFGELKADGKLSEKQTAFYEEQLLAFQVEMKNFTHKDQKPYWTK